MKQVVIVSIIFVLAVYGSGWTIAEEPLHEPTEIPFNIDNLTGAQSAVIRKGNEADSSPYYIMSRPVIFQVVFAGNDANESRGTLRSDRDVDVLIYGLGEERGGGLVDHGWIEHLESGTRVWEMTTDNAIHAGGDPRNRKTVTRMTLKPGAYRLRYVSDDSHAYGDWQGKPPERPTFYGVTVFNMTALPLIEERLKQAGIEALGTSLERPYDKTAP